MVLNRKGSTKRANTGNKLETNSNTNRINYWTPDYVSIEDLVKDTLHLLFFYIRSIGDTGDDTLKFIKGYHILLLII